MRRTLAFGAFVLAVAALPARAQHGAADVIFVPTPQVVVETMLRMANVGPGDYLIDLGSGDGRIVVAAAQRGARALGVDLDRVLLEGAIAAAAGAGVAERAAFREQNLFETELQGATVVTTYLLPEMNLKLRPKLLELPAGTRIVTHDYHMGSWQPDERETLSVPEKRVGNPGWSYVYLWVVPARVAGRWRTEIALLEARQPLEFALEQRFQAVTVREAALGGQPVRAQRPSLRGDELRVGLEIGSGRAPMRCELRGRVAGDELRGDLYIWEGGVRHERRFTARRIAPGVELMN